MVNSHSSNGKIMKTSSQKLFLHLASLSSSSLMWSLFYNSFTDLQLICHKFKYLSVRSMTLSEFTKLYGNYRKPALDHSCHPNMILHGCVQITLTPGLSSTQPLIYFLPPCIGLFWTLHVHAINHRVYGLLCLASFIYHHVFKFHLCGRTYQYFVPFYH